MAEASSLLYSEVHKPPFHLLKQELPLLVRIIIEATRSLGISQVLNQPVEVLE